MRNRRFFKLETIRQGNAGLCPAIWMRSNKRFNTKEACIWAWSIGCVKMPGLIYKLMCALGPLESLPSKFTHCSKHYQIVRNLSMGHCESVFLCDTRRQSQFSLQHILKEFFGLQHITAPPFRGRSLLSLSAVLTLCFWLRVKP